MLLNQIVKNCPGVRISLEATPNQVAFFLGDQILTITDLVDEYEVNLSDGKVAKSVRLCYSSTIIAGVFFLKGKLTNSHQLEAQHD